MPRYETRYVHKISPSDKDVGAAVELSPADLESRKSLSAALRRARILGVGESILRYRVEKDRVVAFPKASIWHSIILSLPGTSHPIKKGSATYVFFTVKGPSGHRWFSSASPVTWTAARDRLIAAGVLDPGGLGKAGGQMLSVDPVDFKLDRAERLP